MLFNSFEFLFVFLPLTVAVFFLLGGRAHRRLAVAWLVGASLFFYGWWNFAYVSLILFSILFNYALGLSLGRGERSAKGRWLLGFGVTVDLGLLGYFKYANFFVDNLSVLLGTDFTLGAIVLPLAISFFTFQQIAYLVDAYRGETREHDFLHYCLFVSFFPQLIAGPIVHHKEMLPQFARDAIYRLQPRMMAAGVTIFTLGLFKKVVLADGIAPYSTNVFSAVERGLTPTLLEAWGAALAFTLQLYFDFSGYSDMAIGIACLFGIRLPINFNSPYKARNIIEFWRRWHMTLSRFLRDYLYIGLGGNRKGAPRRYANLMITMVLGGLWHGAGWTFLAWGALHGLYLMVNHGWRRLCRTFGWGERRFGRTGVVASSALTFLAVVVAWVFFRAESFGGAMAVINGMVGVNGLGAAKTAYFDGSTEAARLGALLAIVWLMPNSLQLLSRDRPGLAVGAGDIYAEQDGLLRWQPNRGWALVITGLALTGFISMGDTSEFLYYQF